MGIAMEIYRHCEEAVREHRPGRIETVELAVGELAAVEPDLLIFAWEALTADGPDTGSTLEIQWCPAHQHCPACDHDVDRSEGSWLRLCPDCGGILQVSGGFELDVLRLTFVGDDEEEA
jgi:Zn finger protein HypA/HybF involved in hydrogenase expression